MTNQAKTAGLQDVKNLIKVVGYEIIKDMGDVFVVQDESCIPIYCGYQDGVLSNSIPCHKVLAEKLTTDVMIRMLSADNGLSTSAFRIQEAGSGQYQILLTNFCKLQALEEDDADDIWSALNFLEIDLVKARSLLQDIL